MPTVITHGLLGAAGYRCAAGDAPGLRVGACVAAALTALPDIDVVWWNLTTYGAPWGHRGMTHSLTFAAVSGLVAAAFIRKRVTFPGGYPALAGILFVLTATHGFTDSLTNGGYGIAFFSPLDVTRYFMPVTPVPVAPITVNPLNSSLWRVLGAEAALFGPIALALWTARSELGRPKRLAVLAALVACAAAWFLMS